MSTFCVSVLWPISFPPSPFWLDLTLRGGVALCASTISNIHYISCVLPFLHCWLVVCVASAAAQTVQIGILPSHMKRKVCSRSAFPECKTRLCKRKVRTIRSTLCSICFMKQAARSGARSAGNYEGNPGNVGNS